MEFPTGEINIEIKITGNGACFNPSFNGIPNGSYVASEPYVGFFEVSILLLMEFPTGENTPIRVQPVQNLFQSFF